MNSALTRRLSEAAREAGADLFGVAPISRFDNAPKDVHPGAIFPATQSVVAIACRMVRGALKTIEEGAYWQAYNCDSYQFLNEVLAPSILRRMVLDFEDEGYTAVPLHNPVAFGKGRPVKPDGTRPDGCHSFRVIGVAAGLGELGLSKLLLTPEFGPRQRVYAVLTDAALEPSPLVEPGTVCDGCGLCRAQCPADAIAAQRNVDVVIEGRTYSHGALDVAKCLNIHRGNDPRFSPFLVEHSSPDNPPEFYRFLDHRFRHRSICGARGCVRACMDHLEKAGRIRLQYRTPMIEGKRWELDVPWACPHDGATGTA